jgi:hypothetical protein
VRVHYPELHLCTDNGAMIALAAAMRLQAGRRAAAPALRLRRAAALAAQLMTSSVTLLAGTSLASLSVSTPCSSRAWLLATSRSVGSS